MRKNLPDIQRQKDKRKISIDKVGIRDIRYPIIVKDKTKGYQKTIANINMYVNLPHHFKGTHMSRFVEVLNETHKEAISVETIPMILLKIKEKLEAEVAYIELKFPYFIEKKAPISRAKSLLDYECTLIANSNDKNFSLTVKVPLLTVCPCSKEISKHGAHNQRAFACVTVISSKMIWIEDIVEIVEKCGSAPIYSLLKREDEKYITETSYENPAFVEDVARNIVIALNKIEKIKDFIVEVSSIESIHNHYAYAKIKKK